MIVVAENGRWHPHRAGQRSRPLGYDGASVTDGQLVLSTLESGDVGLLILDLRMPG
jgi:CheY-like chemotaxis protein